jgi:hypothetical protein
MRRLLKPHPHSHCLAVTRIEVQVAHSRSRGLELTYTVIGQIGDIAIPPVAASARGDNLWQHTCFEAFVRGSDAVGYYELNFAPSTLWSACRFTGYRTGMCEVAEISAIPIDVWSKPDSYVLHASVEIDRLSALPLDTSWRLGLSAVIEETFGAKSYWALAHPPGNPDFHHATGFAHELSPSGQS